MPPELIEATGGGIVYQPNTAPALAEALGLAETERVAGFIHIGTESSIPPERPRPDLDRIVTWCDA